MSEYRARVDYDPASRRFYVKIKTPTGGALMWGGWIRSMYEVADLLCNHWKIPMDRIEGLT